ncbi:cytochrome P450 [Myxococcota bacterium]|nr:cytochrome P450 [Myxococcota bacterium]
MVDFHPFADSFLDDPHASYRALRDEAPAYYLEEFDCWFLSRFEDVWRAEQDLEATTVRAGVTSYQLLAPREQREASRQMLEEVGFVALAGLDPPNHTIARRVLSPRFLPRASRSLEPFTREWVGRFIDDFIERGECDVIGDLAMRISVRVACQIAGIPLSDADLLADMVNQSFSRNPGDETEFEFGASPLYAYLIDFIAQRRRQPGDGVVDLLIQTELGGRALTDIEIASHMSLLVVGGTETLPKAFSAAVHRLWEHPDQRAELIADSSLIGPAFWEALRLDMPTQMLGRTMTRPMEFHGQTLEPGQGVLFLFASANRDEREFENADHFDIHRRAPRILSFGHGTHRCLGANMAQMEGWVMLEELLKRLPEYEVDLERATRFRSEFFAGFSSLPLRFEPGARLGP